MTLYDVISTSLKQNIIIIVKYKIYEDTRSELSISGNPAQIIKYISDEQT